jgi:chromate transporter
MTMAEPAQEHPISDASQTVPLSDLFLAFLRITLSGFGGTLPFARQTLVLDRQWLSDRQFVEALSLCQFLPGPNVVNLSIVVGQRFRGVVGALSALAGLVLAPMSIVLVLAVLYDRFGQVPAVDRVLNGISAAAPGLVVAMGVEMARLFGRVPRAVLFAALAFVATGLLQWPIVPVLAVLAPISVAAAWRRR